MRCATIWSEAGRAAMRDGRGKGEGSRRPGGRTASRADFFPRLVAMQRFIHARNFAVFKSNNSGLPGHRKLTAIIDNFASDSPVAASAVLDCYGGTFLEHLETSSLPLLWNGIDDSQTAEMADFRGCCRSAALPFRSGSAAWATATSPSSPIISI